MYEITFIVLEEEKTKLVKDILEKNKAKILWENSIGRKNFVYPIKKEDAGFYHTIFFDLETNNINEISQLFKLEKEILRYIIVKNPQPLEEIKARAKLKFLKTKTATKTASETPTEKTEEITIKEEPQKETDAKIVKTKESSSKKLKQTKTTAKKQKTKKDTKKETSTAVTEKALETKNEEERIKKLEEKLDELLNE